MCCMHNNKVKQRIHHHDHYQVISMHIWMATSLLGLNRKRLPIAIVIAEHYQLQHNTI